jgi:hypothetical protein
MRRIYSRGPLSRRLGEKNRWGIRVAIELVRSKICQQCAGCAWWREREREKERGRLLGLKDTLIGR